MDTPAQPFWTVCRSVHEAKERFNLRRGQKKVLTFVGYSTAEYQDEEKMLDMAHNILSNCTASDTIVNIGGTTFGIGAVYPTAKQMGFETTGVVSTLALQCKETWSPNVDSIYFVQDETWGGYLIGEDQLSPTSQVMVEISDAMIGIGGGKISGEELLAMKRAGKPVEFFPADMNHDIAKNGKDTLKENKPLVDYKGAAHFAIMSKGKKEGAEVTNIT